MEIEKLQEANKINKEIEMLERFIRGSGNRRILRLVKIPQQFILKLDGYGWATEMEYHLNTELASNMLGVLQERVTQLKKELENILKG